MKPSVTIIVPVYNSEKYLEKCLDSIKKQSYQNLQIIVVNDGSQDGSQEIIERFIKMDIRFFCIQQTNHGVAIARNRALDYATGKYYLFVDADDYIGRNYVKDLVKCAEENHSELVICGYTLVYSKRKKQIRVVPKGYASLKREEWAYRISSVWGRLYRSSFWREHELRFEYEVGARAEDIPIVMYANTMAKNICVIPSAEYFYVQHSESAMHKKQNNNIVFRFPYYSFTKMYQRLKGNEMLNSKEFFDIGVLKFLAQFEFCIYRNADWKEKKIFMKYVCRLLKDDWVNIVSAWKKNRARIQFPLLHKIAIELFIFKYERRM